ncbi:MBL fold metallo-hydrolase [Aliiglaciecola sp. SL4]|uniref:MBL fold metallo-hydrolase n=1 Tax=Aliiglaciecola sp. SL4 TaxID=3239806 RepID=UPI00355B5766
MPKLAHLIKQLTVLTLLFSVHCFANQQDLVNEESKNASFELIVLGDSGGIEDGNLSAFLLRSVKSHNYVALDAGTIVNGINQSVKQNAFADLPIRHNPNWSTSGTILRDHVKGYLVSHSHLDHINGLLVASPEDTNKNIYALASVNKMIGETYFNGIAWANFTDRGRPPTLNKYHVVDLPIGEPISVTDTQLKVTAFSLSHPVESSAFVLENGSDMFVYFGDTGADIVEKQGKLQVIWRYLAKQMQHKQLRGMVIEVSFENERPHNLLFGHLTPKLLMQELHSFASKVGGKAPLQDLKVVISHIKYTLANNLNPRLKIKQQLDEANNLGLQIIIPEQGQKLVF